MNYIKGLIFDYGGTIDTDGVHWSEVLWQAYQKEEIPVTKSDFLDAYVYAERQLATNPVILPTDTFLAVLRAKTDLQTRYLVENGLWQTDELIRRPDSEHIALDCYACVLSVLRTNREVIRRLSGKYPLALVSNFYGNIHSVLADFRLDCFRHVIESSVVGVRKPNPEIFTLGVNALGLKPEEVAVVGDSYTKDIIPAHQIGCTTVWLQGTPWARENSLPEHPECADVVIHSLRELTTGFARVNS